MAVSRERARRAGGSLAAASLSRLAKFEIQLTGRPLFVVVNVCGRQLGAAKEQELERRPSSLTIKHIRLDPSSS